MCKFFHVNSKDYILLLIHFKVYEYLGMQQHCQEPLESIASSKTIFHAMQISLPKKHLWELTTI